MKTLLHQLSRNSLSFLLVLLSSLLMNSCSENSKEHFQVYPIQKDGNIYLQLSKDSVRQITFTGKEEFPTYLDSLKSILFLSRSTDGTKTLKLIEVQSLSEKAILEGLNYIQEMSFSINQKKVFFSDLGQFHIVSLENSTTKKIPNAKSFVVLAKAPYQDRIVLPRIVGDFNDRRLEYTLIDSEGLTLKKFERDSSLIQFGKQELPNALDQLSNLVVNNSTLLNKIDSIESQMKVYDSSLKKLSEQILTKNNELNKANSDMRRINEFQFGRSETLKRKQIENQTALIRYVKSDLDELESKFNEQVSMMESSFNQIASFNALESYSAPSKNITQ